MKFLTVLPVVVAFAVRGQAPIGAPAPSTPVVVSGRVVAAETGDPVPNVRVTVSPPGAGVPVVLTDRNGRFRLSVPAGTARIVASKVGFAPESAVPAMDGDPPDVRLRRAASISGRIVD